MIPGMPAGSDVSAGDTRFIGPLRVGVTALVIAHHTAIVYGGSGSWYWRELPSSGAPSSIALSLLCAFDQAFFMGLFFLLAGYFTPASLLRRGLRGYLAERALRLGLPLLVFGFVLGPMTLALAATARGLPFGATWARLVIHRGYEPGPLWFCQALLLMALAAAAWHLWVRPLRGPEPAATAAPLPPAASWAWSAVGVGAVALLLRQWWPVGSEWGHMQLGYFASYVFLFALGVAAAPGQWLQRVPPDLARRWRRVAWLSYGLLPATGVAFGALRGVKVDYSGGLGVPAIVYAFWEPLVAWGVIAALLLRCQRRFAQPSPRWQRWSANAYGAFVLHAPVLVAVSLALRPWAAPALLKWAVAATLATGLAFAGAGALRRLPGVARVL